MRVTLTNCQKCAGRTQLFLCQSCTHAVRRQLLSLPAIIDNLKETALGMTRLNNESSRQLGFTSRTPTLHDGASCLLVEIDSTIGQWARSIARTHRLLPSPPVTWHRPWDTYRHTTSDFAVFLAANADKLALDPDVGELCGSLDRVILSAIGNEDRDGLMDRRTPAQFCGPCPATINDHRHCEGCAQRPHECATQLYSKRGVSEVTCPGCGSQYRVEALLITLMAHADEHRGTIVEIHQVLRMLGTPVEIKTLYHWASPRVGRLKPAGYMRADGRRISVTRQSDEDKPVYRISDARKQREESVKPGRRGRPLNGEGKGERKK